MRTDGGDGRYSTDKTSTHMLLDLQDPENRTVWQAFGNYYRPMLIGYARRSFGLPPQDAEDAAQTIMIAFFEAYLRGDYEREKGRLRKWLFGIATNVLRSHIRKQARRHEVQPVDQLSGTCFMGRVPDEASLEDVWEAEWRRAVYRKCMELVRADFDAKTLEAFELFSKDDMSADDVGKKLGMSPNAVYLARHRILKRIRELVPQIEDLG